VGTGVLVDRTTTVQVGVMAAAAVLVGREALRVQTGVAGWEITGRVDTSPWTVVIPDQIQHIWFSCLGFWITHHELVASLPIKGTISSA
jgi:hypothetical protein